MACDHLKLFHNNGRRVKIASGSWEQVRSSDKPPVRHGESFTIMAWTRGDLHTTITAPSWEGILEQMRLKLGFDENEDASVHVFFALGLLSWAALMNVLAMSGVL